MSRLTRIVAAVAIVTLVVPLAACGHKANESAAAATTADQLVLHDIEPGSTRQVTDPTTGKTTFVPDYVKQPVTVSVTATVKVDKGTKTFPMSAPAVRVDGSALGWKATVIALHKCGGDTDDQASCPGDFAKLYSSQKLGPTSWVTLGGQTAAITDFVCADSDEDFVKTVSGALADADNVLIVTPEGPSARLADYCVWIASKKVRSSYEAYPVPAPTALVAGPDAQISWRTADSDTRHLLAAALDGVGVSYASSQVGSQQGALFDLSGPLDAMGDSHAMLINEDAGASKTLALLLRACDLATATDKTACPGAAVVPSLGGAAVDPTVSPAPTVKFGNRQFTITRVVQHDDPSFAQRIAQAIASPTEPLVVPVTADGPSHITDAPLVLLASPTA